MTRKDAPEVKSTFPRLTSSAATPKQTTSTPTISAPVFTQPPVDAVQLLRLVHRQHQRC